MFASWLEKAYWRWGWVGSPIGVASVTLLLALLLPPPVAGSPQQTLPQDTLGPVEELQLEEEVRAPESEEPVRERVRRGDVVRIGSGITIAKDERVDGDVVSVGGSVVVEGEVAGDVVVVGGSLTLKATARVRGDAVSVGGRITREPGAYVGGDEAEINAPIHLGGFPWWKGPWSTFGPWGWGLVAGVGKLMRTLLLVGLVALLGMGLVLFFPRHLDEVSATVSQSFLKAGAVGFLTQILFFPGLVVLTVALTLSIVGILLLPALPLLVLAFLVAHLFGYIAVAQVAGRSVVQRVKRGIASPYVIMLLGLLAIVSITLLARLVGLTGGVLAGLALLLAALGLGVRYVAWTIGFGSVVLSRFGTRPVALPVTPSSPESRGPGVPETGPPGMGV